MLPPTAEKEEGVEGEGVAGEGEAGGGDGGLDQKDAGGGSGYLVFPLDMDQEVGDFVREMCDNVRLSLCACIKLRVFYTLSKM